jgi:hypothetical protein
MTLAARYNAEAKRLMPHMADDLAVDPGIDNAGHIDEIVFRRSEYLGGMAAVLLALLEQQK